MLVCIFLKNYLDDVKRIQKYISLEGPLLPHFEEYILEEGVVQYISSPMTEADKNKLE